jgi:TctA family transporter
MIEENCRRALLLSAGDMTIFVQRPISATFIGICATLIVAQDFFAVRSHIRKRRELDQLPQPPSIPGMPDIE